MDLEAHFRHGFPVLEGERVLLRGFRPADRDDVFALYADKEAVRFGYAPKMDQLSDADHVISETARLARERELFHFGVARREDDRIIGHATLFDITPAHRRAELGYSIVKTSWGRGLGTEAAGVLIGFAFTQLDLRRIEADVDPRNIGSIRVLEKHGFRREGYLRERWELAGEIQDGVMFGLLRREWTGDGAGRVG